MDRVLIRTFGALSVLVPALVVDRPVRADAGDPLVVAFAAEFDGVVTAVSHTASTVGRSPAAVHVITREMIHCSGARSLPEALRIAPGVQVARITSGNWSVSIRGFAGGLLNKLLVQIDGRSVYNMGFAGVYWDAVDVVFDNIERIEVIRGPCASVWGANAVNGIIRVITKKVDDMQVGPDFFQNLPNALLHSEVLLSDKLGYRAQPFDWFSWDTALFYFDYDRLATTTSTGVLTSTTTSDSSGSSYGAELPGALAITPAWRLSGHDTVFQGDTTNTSTQNLLDVAHQEFGGFPVRGTKVERGVYVSAVWRR